MPNHSNIYQNEAEQYERLIKCQPSLAEVIQAIIPYSGMDIIDLGAGTGRLACVLAEKANSILLLDQSAAMLQVAANKLTVAECHNWRVETAEHPLIPAVDQSYDLIVSGWSLCYIASSNNPAWKHNLQLVLQEIKRVLRPGGVCIIFETLGTGVDAPFVYDFMEGYKTKLEHEYGFLHNSISMHYEFVNLSEAEELSRFFFGDDMANLVTEVYGTRLPEFAGVWWRSF